MSLKHVSVYKSKEARYAKNRLDPCSRFDGTNATVSIGLYSCDSQFDNTFGP